MKTLETAAVSFGRMLEEALEETGVTKDAVADEMGVHVATVYRLLSGTNPSKKNIVSAVRAVNKLAMYTAISENAALAVEGYDITEDRDAAHLAADTITELLAQLPEEVQDDVLEMVKALHRRHVRNAP